MASSNTNLSAAPAADAGPGAAAAGRWQAILADAVRDPVELCRLVGLRPAMAASIPAAAGSFPLLVPRPFLARIRQGDPRDPLLLQIMPRTEEQAQTPGFQADPLGEADAMVGPGLLWKYQGRSLIVSTGACAVHCRFCFRRHFPYGGGCDLPAAFARGGDSVCGQEAASTWEWEPALRRIAREESIHEVILSGGDPLTESDERLARLAARLADIPHVRRLRIHTRLPVMIPQRVTAELAAWLRGTRLAPIVVVHVNHPAEINDAVAAALGRLVDAGVPLLQQGVLLRGVNDSVEVLTELYERLVDLRVMPYYLHQLDRVAGAAHFEVPQATGAQLMAQLRTLLPGYAVPRYVRETPKGTSKEILA